MLRARIPLPLWLALVLVVAHGVPAAGQDTRAAIIEAEQAAKAKVLAPHVPNRAEQTLVRLKSKLIDDPNGIYPVFGSVYSGGGFTLGAGYRRFYSDRAHVDLQGMYSLKNYKFLEVSTNSLGHADGRLDLHVRTGWRDATQVAYHGLGMDTPVDEAAFRMKQTYAGGNIDVRPVPWVVAGLGLAYEDFNLESGAGSGPSIEEVYTPETAPGLGASPSYLHATASGGIDTRPSAGYARHGGLYEISYDNFADRDDTYSFDRMTAEIVQHIPILRENWVISLHGRMQTTLDDGDAVPYFLLPSLGGGSSLRGYSSWRFRDRHSILMSAEWRWIPSRLGLDMAFFYDTGKVTDRFRAISWTGLASDVGVGIRFHSPLATPLRVELAKGREGISLVFSGSAAF